MTHLCPCCADEVEGPGMCGDCNRDFWTELMVEEAAIVERHTEEPIRG